MSTHKSFMMDTFILSTIKDNLSKWFDNLNGKYIDS